MNPSIQTTMIHASLLFTIYANREEAVLIPLHLAIDDLITNVLVLCLEISQGQRISMLFVTSNRDIKRPWKLVVKFRPKHA